MLTNRAREGECYANVAQHVEQHGGERVTGWLIWEVRGVLLNAERHSCWCSPAGEMVDVTPKPDGEKRIVFQADAEPWDGNPECPVVQALSGARPIREYVRAFLDLKQAMVESKDTPELHEAFKQASVGLFEFLGEHGSGSQ